MTEAGKLRRSVYLVNFLYSLQFGLLLYFNSSFLLDLGFSGQAIGLIFAAGYALAIAVLLLIPRLLPRFGNRSLFTTGLLIAGAIFFAISTSTSQLSVALLLPVALAISTSMHVLIDVFLQTASADKNKVGVRRGLMSSLTNGAYIASQSLVILLLARGPFSLLYAATAVLIVPLAVLSYLLFRRFRDPAYERPKWGGVLGKLRVSKDLRNIFFIQFLLRLFYSIMVVYTPIYLHEYVGLSLPDMGVVFAVMLLPFVLFEVLIGRLEDTRWGEQEVLVSGFVVIGVATAALAFFSIPHVALWAAALFATRVGAVLIDVGSEAYFFKHVMGSNAGEVSSFRMLYPFAYIIGPLAAAALLFVIPLKLLFVVLGVVMLLGIFPALALRDTR
ncbi:MAG TPA: MFS transporter [Candidatus Paceibacterota bacterium]|jgi:MFS family permease